MHDILHDFPVFAPIANVYDAVSTPAGLDQWWTLRSSGRPLEGTMFELDFGPNHHWQAVVTRADPCLELKAHPHMIRHACGSALANKGHDMRRSKGGRGTGRSRVRRSTRPWRRTGSRISGGSETRDYFLTDDFAGVGGGYGRP